jgi:hypothetical protein
MLTYYIKFYIPQKILPETKFYGIFVTIKGSRNKEKTYEILKFDIPRVPTIQIAKKKGQTFRFC